MRNQSVTLLGKVCDALDAIVLKDVVNSPLRDHGPNDYLGVITNIVYDFVLGAINFFANLAQFVVDLGLAVIGALKSLTQQASNAIGAAVTVISNTLNAFKTWAIQFIEDTLETLFGPIINTIKNEGDEYVSGVAAACTSMNYDVQSTGSVSGGTKAQLSKAIMGDLFVTVAAIATIIVLAMTLLTVVTGPYGFLTGAVITAAVSMIVVVALDSIVATFEFSLNVQDSLRQIFGAVFDWSGESIDNNDIFSLAIDGLISMFEAYAIAFTFVCPGLTKEDKKIGRDVALSVTGLIIAVFGAGLVHDDTGKFIGLVGLGVSIVGLAWSGYDLYKMRNSPNDSYKVALGMSMVVSFTGLIKNLFDVKGDWFGH